MGLRRWLGLGKPKTDPSLDQLIAPEIKEDEFYHWIVSLVSTEPVSTVLEIGSSDGSGSTAAFVEGISKAGGPVQLFCVEVSRVRFAALQARYRHLPFVHCYNGSTVSPAEFPTPEAVAEFYHSHDTTLRRYKLERVLAWLQRDIDYLAGAGLHNDVIGLIKAEHGIERFDAVLIDGSEFTGRLELEKVLGARILFLDDINTFKNFEAHNLLLADPRYELVSENRELRNGYSIFRLRG